MPTSSTKAWQVRDRFLEMRSRWITLIGEHLQDDRGEILEYWRIEKPDSVIVLAIQGDRLLLPIPSYRVGIGQSSLDFAGGRVTEGKSPIEIVPVILQRELGIANEAIAQIIPLNSEGWAVNSSFSNQRLYGFIAHIEATAKLSSDFLRLQYPITPEALYTLRQSLNCLQCRALLMEWMLNYSL
ncbi:NUDIX hydrolase [Pseudanabaena sp. ABRG5-3]|uniref:NUDIX hydrolase n=1 Tax=Pseudanabaena sp. ABRG5-3 TaxID=685565 RepID=UPI000DC6D53C|nr:NUDIX hydrolase [Pseudanabaena sp. ABRG5-3]BBC27024.1 NUDIX hydrolase [Pseudanabaena sp. ABRG5-3]